MEESDENIETIMDVDSFEDCDSLLYSGYDDTDETNFQCHSPRYSSHNESLMVIEDDDSLSDISCSGNIDDKSTSIKIPEEKIIVSDDSDSDVEIFKPLGQFKKNIVSGATKNTNLFTRQKENNSSNAKKFFNHNASLVKFNPSIKSNQFKLASTATVNRPKTTTTHLQPESSGNTEIGLNKSLLRPKQQLKITSSNESKSEVYLVPHNGMNYMISKGIPKRSPLLKSNSSSSPTLKAPSAVIRPTEQKNQIVVMSSKDALSGGNKEESKFIARMQPLPGGKYKMVPDQGQVPINLESVFKRNPNFTKQKLATHPTPNENKVSDIFHIGKSYQLANIKETRQFQHKTLDVPSINSSWSKMSKTVELDNASRNKKFITHTVTSEDPIEKHSKMFVQNCEVKIKTNCNQKMNTSPRFIQLSSNSESLKQSDSLPLSHTRYDKITKNDHKTIQLLSSNSLTKSKTKLNSYKMLKNGGDHSNSSGDEIIKVNNSETRVSQNSNIRRAVEEHSNKHKVSLSDEIIDLDAQSDSSNEDDTSDQFISCKYEYCDTLVYEPELIDDLYCSLACKNLDIKKTVTEEEHFINETSNLSDKTIVDRKNLLTKLENRINKRKQKLKTSCPEDIVKENDDWNEQLINFFDKPSKEESQPPLKSLLPINSPEVIDDDDDDDDDNYFDLKPLIEDKEVLNYMTGLQFRSAPKKLFDRPFPTEKNLFVVGQKLEGIDPKHEALFCVMTVSEVCGYRIKLHFDGYENDYDFWVNADCPNLFHPGWCEMNLRILQPPNNYGNAFDWISYLRECQALPAPKRNFVSTKNLNSCKNQHKFHIGGKLEALDKLTRTLPKQLICVATVADILGNRVRIHFDGWTDDFDYWVDITSTNIHPVRWCDNNGRTLSPPSGYNDMKGKKPFNWTEYLAETNSEPVPEEAFVRRPLRDFSNKMIIEVVDLVVPRLLRIAKVVDVRGDELKIVYDGFDNDYAYWVEDDSPDIHPVGWSSKTNHPIELPPASDTLWSCTIRGCKGYGNSSNSMKVDHVEIIDCPYEIDSWKTAVAGLAKMPDRLKTHNVIINTTLTSSKIKSDIHQDDKNKEKTRINTEHMNLAKIKEKMNEKRLNLLLDANDIEPKCDTAIRNTLFNDTISSSVSMETQSTYWTRHNAQLGIPLFNTTDTREWTIQEVASYVKKVVEFYNSNINTNEEISISDRFIDQAIDGDALLMLNQDEIMKILKVPLGLALKITNAIIMLRQRTIGNECM
ncbi:uncharacterized protein LOC100164434 isoform X2 [Acyrthosiphon pisum]|uniref:SAM domain-containing protein n=1 Tax=Acyrthosiphon pisum TaxID=7029 RepID=A0A8R2JSJ7_ACYPI|nr:uncharacterized protein LOC100164434 isoform X2 [Acyrthosiphon pisum]